MRLSRSLNAFGRSLNAFERYLYAGEMISTIAIMREGSSNAPPATAGCTGALADIAKKVFN